MDFTLPQDISLWGEKELEVFMKNNSSLFFAFAFRYIKQEDEIEDLIQECYLKLWRDRRKIGLVTSPINYLFTMIKNGALNRIEHNRKMDVGIPFDMSDDVNFFNNIVEAESSMIIAQAVKSLSPQSQELLELVIDGKSLEEIAIIMDLSINSVKTVKYRAITKLAKILPGKLLSLFL